MNIAVIPARGGSKRIPNKNIKPFAGMPIMAYSIKAAKTAGVFDKIISRLSGGTLVTCFSPGST